MKIRAGVLLTISFLLACQISPVLAQDSLNVSRVADRYDIWEHLYDMDIQGDIAYLVEYDGSVQTIDISDPEHPVHLGGVRLPYYCRDIAVVGDYAYVAMSMQGVAIIDVSDPATPRFIGIDDNVIGVDYLVASGTTLYAQRNHQIVFALDISNPTELVGLGSCEYDYVYATNMTVSGNYLYVSSFTEGVRVFDVSNPSSIYEVTHFGTYARDFKIEEETGLGVLAAWSHGFSIYDFSAGVESPVLRSETDLGFTAVEAAINGNYAYICGSDTLIMIDISAPDSPSIISEMTLGSTPTNLMVDSDGLLYLTEFEGGMHIVSPSDPSDLQLLSTSSSNGYIYDSVVQGDLLYVAAGTEGVRIMDITNRDNPVEISTCDTPGRANKIAAFGDYIYVADYEAGFTMIDANDLDQPEVIYTHFAGKMCENIAYSNGYVFAVDGYDFNTFIFDVRDPENILEVPNQNLSTPLQSVGFFDHYLVTAYMSDGLNIYDLSTIEDVEFVANLTWEANEFWPFGLCIEGTRAYLYNTNGAMRVVDLSDINNPVEVAAATIPEDVYEITLYDQHAVMADQYGIVHVVDLSNDGLGSVVGYYNTSVVNPYYEDRMKVEVSEGYTYCSNHHTLTVLDCNEAFAITEIAENVSSDLPGNFAITQAYPNPFNGSNRITLSLPTSGRVQVSVYNMLGQRVTVLEDRFLTTGNHPVMLDWQGLASGNYFIRATLNGKDVTAQRVTLVR